MTISVFELFSIGIGPSSSHTVGPMRAANAFVALLNSSALLSQVMRVQVDLYGSLALTGKGHGTDVAILTGLEGKDPATVEPESLGLRAHTILSKQQLNLGNEKLINFTSEHLIFRYKELLPHHTNGMRFTAFDQDGNPLLTEIYYSIGGGFILTEQEFSHPKAVTEVPYPFETAFELLAMCKLNNLRIHELMLANEACFYSVTEVKQRLLNIAAVMESCIEKGCRSSGILPGILKVRRRAGDLFNKLTQNGTTTAAEQGDVMNWLNVYAMAVNEENAAGGRVVTAPTNGAAGIVPAVLQYYKVFCAGADEEGVINFLLTAGAIAILYKKRASISGAEVGCQGEVGAASSMAAGALAAVLGGSVEQIENAAEIAMEHHLGMTCDPIGGLVQIPCIERNAMGALKAVNAARLALLEDGVHKVSLDKVIATMFQTGKDMMTIYKETSLGGLAVNVTEC